MLQGWGYKYKLIALFAGSVLLLLLGYFLAIDKTVAVFQENNQLSGLTSTSESEILHQINIAVQEKRKVDSLMNLFSSAESEATMITSLFEIADQYLLNISGFNNQESLSGANATFFKLKMQGHYVNMVKYLRAVEQKLPVCEIMTVRFFTETDRRTKEEKLFVDVLIKQVKYDEN